MLGQRDAIKNMRDHKKRRVIQGRWATRSLEAAEKEQQLRMSTRNPVVCDLQMEGQRDIKRLLEVQPVLNVRETPGHNG